MATYNPASTMGTIVPIAGMGISLGILAHTARGISDTMYGPRRNHSSRRRRYSSYKKPRLTIPHNTKPLRVKPVGNKPLRWRY